MRSVVGSRRRSTTSTTLLNASAFGLRGYVDTLSPLISMLLLDRPCVLVGTFLIYYLLRLELVLVFLEEERVMQQ